MNATPKTMAGQVRKAHAAQTERERIARVAPRTRLAYSTSTGQVRRDSQDEQASQIDDDPFCFVCGRNTDHFAEHDDLVETGKARYGDNGNVYPI